MTTNMDQRYWLRPEYESAYDLTVTGTPTFDLAKDKLKIAGTAVTATAAELNYLDIATLGTGAASKAVVLDTGDDYTWPATGILTYGVLNDATTTITATGLEINYLDITTLGTGAASKAVVLDSGDDYTWPATGILTYGASALNASGTELNAMQMDTKMTLFEDFHGTWLRTEAVNVDRWISTKGSGLNTEETTTVTDSLNGEVTLKSSTADGATSANASNITGANLGYKANQGGLVIEARLKIDDITEAYIFVGFTDVGSATVEHPIDFTDASDTLIADADNACGIVFSGDATTQEWCHGGVKATTPTASAFSGTAPVNDTYVVLRAEVDSSGGVRGFIDGTAVGASIANAVTATTALTPAVVCSNTAAAATIMTLDYLWVQQDR